MNQHDQMRQTVDRLLGEIVCLEWAIAAQDPWPELEVRVRDMKKIAQQALAAEPALMKYYDEHGNDRLKGLVGERAPLVRLTDEEIDKCYGPATRAFKRFKYSVRGQMSMPQDSFEWHFAHAIMDAMIAKNGG